MSRDASREAHHTSAEHTSAERRRTTAAPLRQKYHSGEGHGLSNAIAFTVMMALFLSAIYAFSFFSSGPWSFAVGLLLVALAFFIPQGIMGRSDSHEELRH